MTGRPDAWVYLLRCGDGSLYCGWTVDLDARLAVHAAGRGAKYTRSRLPVELVWAAPQEDRAAAMREERRIKRLSRTEKLALLDSPSGQTSRAPHCGSSRGSDAPIDPACAAPSGDSQPSSPSRSARPG
ncbi:GIY-YIG nuclease family protein [Conexibacter sp. W3-3-2]|uniref:GIY-YIG domain-containing protein n=1 Tax=Paraconexibacter algicola TaxID=2133960 RepID=A0A2T4UFN0_9ACTN|nr:GIY-YIG nuclease family protein [Conexibacter sp. W3-3-2]MTD44166.1 GIY-YIG nuclease family protein [Conexibacter sp. W3-3-2]PTL56589.1 hypothetical protein C7Y72_16710 [Paraconexibacter algicola]